VNTRPSDADDARNECDVGSKTAPHRSHVDGRAETQRRRDVPAAMRSADIKPEFVYAYERTGLLVTLDNRHLFSAADLDEWDDAVAEYRERTLAPNVD
jgi:hypothetical protein